VSRVPFGDRIRHAREARQLSLHQVAERTGLTKSFLSRVERDATSPSVTSLVAICEAIGLPPSELFRVSETVVMRAADRPHAILPGLSVVDTLLTAPEERRLTVIETVASGQGSGGDDLYSLPCETEVCYVIEGAITLLFGDREVELLEGDTVTFDGTEPHSWRCAPGIDHVRLLWMLAPALPDPLGHTEAATR
jgi:transcriptional regulator with XRE-family HTH domain